MKKGFNLMIDTFASRDKGYFAHFTARRFADKQK